MRRAYRARALVRASARRRQQRSRWRRRLSSGQHGERYRGNPGTGMDSFKSIRASSGRQASQVGIKTVRASFQPDSCASRAAQGQRNPSRR